MKLIWKLIIFCTGIRKNGYVEAVKVCGKVYTIEIGKYVSYEDIASAYAEAMKAKNKN